MKLYLVLERSNLFEINGKDFDFSKELITYRETIYNKEIEKLSSNEIKKFKHNVFESMRYTFPRNGFEYIKDKGQESLNVLILDYSLEKDWEKDSKIQKLINFIESYFEVSDYKESVQNLDMSSIEHILEIESYGDYDLEKLESLQNLLDEYEIEYKMIYEKTSQINAGASGGDLIVIIAVAANIATILTFFKKQYPYENDVFQTRDVGKVKKQISKNYKIHESQLKLETIDYNDETRETTYLFESRKYQYYMVYDKGILKRSYREEKTTEIYLSD